MGKAAYQKCVAVSADGGTTWLKLPATSPTLDIQGEVLDDTDLKTNAGWRSRILGLNDWAIKADSNFIPADTAIAAVIAAKLNRSALQVAYLYDGQNGYKGPCVVESAGFNGEVTGLEKISISLQASGALAVANISTFS